MMQLCVHDRQCSARATLDEREDDRFDGGFWITTRAEYGFGNIFWIFNSSTGALGTETNRSVPCDNVTTRTWQPCRYAATEYRWEKKPDASALPRAARRRRGAWHFVHTNARDCALRGRLCIVMSHSSVTWRNWQTIIRWGLTWRTPRSTNKTIRTRPRYGYPPSTEVCRRRTQVSVTVLHRFRRDDNEIERKLHVVGRRPEETSWDVREKTESDSRRRGRRASAWKAYTLRKRVSKIVIIVIIR